MLANLALDDVSVMVQLHSSSPSSLIYEPCIIDIAVRHYRTHPAGHEA